MITSTIKLKYDPFDEKNEAIIELDIKSWSAGLEGIVYSVNHYAVSGDTKELIKTLERFRSWEQINSLNDYLESMYSYTGLNKKEIEFTKIQHCLLIETQTNPIYFSKSTNWVLTQNIAA